MACDGSSGCGCTCQCWCEFPQVYFACGIYPAPRPIPDALAFQPLAPVGGGPAPPVFEPVRAFVDGGGLGPPGAPAGPSIIEWGPKRPPGPGPHFGGGGKFHSRFRGWDDDEFLSPPPLESLKHRAPGPVAFPPTAKVRGPGDEVRSEEAGSLAATWSIGDSSGSLQTPGGIPVTATAVRPPDSYLGVQEPPPYLRAALAPPQAGEFLQEAGLGPGAGIGSDRSDPFEDNGRSAPMDPVAAEDAFPEKREPDEDLPMEPGDSPVGVTLEPSNPPALLGPSTAGGVAPFDVLRGQVRRSPLPELPAQGGGSWRPHAGNRPSVRPGVGFSHGKTNPGFAASVDASRRLMDATRRANEAEAEGREAQRRGDATGASNAFTREYKARQDQKAAVGELEDANREADGKNGARLFDSDQAWKEAERQHEREERKLVKMSSGSGDVAAARTAAANLRKASDLANKATRLLAEASSARQDDRVRTAESRERAAGNDVREADARLAAARLKGSPQDIQAAQQNLKNAQDALAQQKATTARTRKEARSPKARQEFKKRKVEAKKAAKAARQAAQDARKAARREKNAARYGPASAVKRAQEEAAKARAVAEAKEAEADRTNRLLTDPDMPLEVPPAGAQAAVPPKTVDCTCDPPCAAFAECMCQCLEGEGAGPAGGIEEGLKGKYSVQASAVAPPDSGNAPKNAEEAWELSERVRKEKESRDTAGTELDDMSSAQPEKRVEESPPEVGKRVRTPTPPPTPYSREEADKLMAAWTAHQEERQKSHGTEVHLEEPEGPELLGAGFSPGDTSDPVDDFEIEVVVDVEQIEREEEQAIADAWSKIPPGERFRILRAMLNKATRDYAFMIAKDALFTASAGLALKEAVAAFRALSSASKAARARGSVQGILAEETAVIRALRSAEEKTRAYLARKFPNARIKIERTEFGGLTPARGSMSGKLLGDYGKRGVDHVIKGIEAAGGKAKSIELSVRAGGKVRRLDLVIDEGRTLVAGEVKRRATLVLREGQSDIIQALLKGDFKPIGKAVKVFQGKTGPTKVKVYLVTKDATFQATLYPF